MGKEFSKHPEVEKCSLCRDKAEFYCNTCIKNLCATCEKKHVIDLDTKYHDLVTYRAKTGNFINEKCVIHPNKNYISWCHSCEQPICITCSGHKNHKTLDIRLVYKTLRQKYREKNIKIRSGILPYDTVIMYWLQTSVNKDVETLKVHVSNTKQSITEMTQRLKDRIDAIISKRVYHIRCMMEHKEQTIKEHISLIQKKEHLYERSANRPVKFLLSFKKFAVPNKLEIHDSFAIIFHEESEQNEKMLQLMSKRYRQAVSNEGWVPRQSFSAFGFGASEGSTLTTQSSLRGSQINVNVAPLQPLTEALSNKPEIRQYKKKIFSDILCGALWGANLLIGTENGLMLLDRSGQGKAYTLISSRRFQQMEVLEGQNILVTTSGKKKKIRVYYLSWLNNKIFKKEANDRRNDWVNVGELKGCVHFKIVKYEKTTILVIALQESIEIYAWAPKPHHKFMAFKSFTDLVHKPLIVDLIVEEGQRLKVLYGSHSGFHGINVDEMLAHDLYIPTHTQGPILPHAIVILPYTNGLELLFCYDNEGVYVNSSGRVMKNIIQWGEMPTSVAYISTGQLIGWGSKGIEIRAAETGHVDAVFRKRNGEKFKFLCERIGKVFYSAMRWWESSCQIYFMTLKKPGFANC